MLALFTSSTVLFGPYTVPQAIVEAVSIGKPSLYYESSLVDLAALGAAKESKPSSFKAYGVGLFNTDETRPLAGVFKDSPALWITLR